MSTQYNAAQLLMSDVGQRRIFEFSLDEPIDLVDATVSRVRGEAKFMLTNFGVLAHVDATGVLQLTCARCLEPFQTQREISFDEEFRPLIDIATGLPSTIPPSDTAFVIEQSHTIDLWEALRQNFILAVDLIPRCSEGCRGLCAGCGVNRNLQTCDCPDADSQSPFAALQTLLVHTDSE